MNLVMLKGRMTNVATISVSANDDMTIARFTMAVDRKGKKVEGKQNADFIPCVAFGKIAETIEKYTDKGTAILIRGHWQTGSYQNKDGKTVYTNDCIVDDFEFCESKKETQDTAPSIPEDKFVSIPDNVDMDLPFN